MRNSKRKKCVRTNNMLGNELMYSYKAFQFAMINAFTTYIEYISRIE